MAAAPPADATHRLAIRPQKSNQITQRTWHYAKTLLATLATFVEDGASTTDPDARLYRKGNGKETKLGFIGHGLMENRHGLLVDACLTRADGHAERVAAHGGYATSQRIRKRIEEAFGCIKTVVGQQKTSFRGRGRVAWAFTFAVADYNLVRLPKLIAEAG
jgi:hypothetical protein